jgi:hypothetical protein
MSRSSWYLWPSGGLVVVGDDKRLGLDALGAEPLEQELGVRPQRIGVADGDEHRRELRRLRCCGAVLGRMADDAAVAGRQPAIDLRCDCVAVAFAPRDGSALTLDDLAVARRIQRLVGDHRHPVGRAGPWTPHGTLAGIARVQLIRLGPEPGRGTCDRSYARRRHAAPSIQSDGR